MFARLPPDTRHRQEQPFVGAVSAGEGVVVMCRLKMCRTVVARRRPWRVRHDASDEIVLEDWMCAGAQPSR
jgi:hypothetical protein